MSQIKRKHDVLTDDERKKFVNEIVTFFAQERDEEIGIVAAEVILDFFLEHIGPTVHNHAIDNTKDWIKERLTNLDIDSEELKI